VKRNVLTRQIPPHEREAWKQKFLHWAAAREKGIYLDSNQAPLSDYDAVAATGTADVLEEKAGNAFEKLAHFRKKHDWLFGYLGYDLKNEVESLESQLHDGIGLPDMGFFCPEHLALLRGEHLEIKALSKNPSQVLEEIWETKAVPAGYSDAPVHLSPRIPHPAYLAAVEAIRGHILAGDVYELNFCQEFYAENAQIDPVRVFERLNAIAQAPFSTFLRWEEVFLLSASPERFLKKIGQKIVSQPIKGTRKRGQNPEEDAAMHRDLAESEKDRSENVMIVDLVRNDFARCCVPGSVRVEELCGIHSFATVHQMISTVSGELPLGEDNTVPALRDCFPMGSMTGAPKVMAMELAEKHERTRRGLYSGAVGYFDPAGNFDFNVVIRSILYNRERQYVSAQVGGAIVYDSVPEQEYEECMVKAAAMMRSLM
jgi:Anthranilate/para-aminobenzoate synthases component I